MIYYTGDIHGGVYRIIDFVKRYHLTANDAIVILGDAGLNYFGNSGGDSDRKRALNSADVPILCIHGNHEERPYLIDTYSESVWGGGCVYVEEEFSNLLFAKDGEIYNLDGNKAIAIGGAYSVDKWYRINRGASWFESEQPTQAIKDRVEQSLADANWRVDLVLSHTCPEKFIPIEAFLPGLDQSTVDRSTEEWLDSLESRLTYKKWMCGHWHIDKAFDKIRFLFNDIITL